MDRFLGIVQPYFAEWGYTIVAVGTFLENATFVGGLVPGDVLLLVAGLYAASGTLELHKVMIAAFAGGVLGDVVGYALGRYAGRWIADRLGKRLFLPKDRLSRVERYFERHGSWAVFLGRFAPLLRTIRTFVAGMSKMPFWKFLSADIAGAALWAAIVPTLGFVFAESLIVARRSLGAAGLVILLVLIVLFVITYRTMVRRIESERRAEKGRDSEPRR